MNPLRFVPFCLSFILASAAIGCASPDGTEDEQSSAAAISGRLSDAKACAVRDAYLRASVDDLVTVAVDALPPAVHAKLGPLAITASASFEVSGVGTVYAIEYTWAGQPDDPEATSVIYFFDSSGATPTVARAHGRATETNLEFLVGYTNAAAAPGETATLPSTLLQCTSSETPR
ncbi:MAG: hypothetical protein U0270_41525 [Labilithrix sp.]